MMVWLPPAWSPLPVGKYSFAKIKAPIFLSSPIALIPPRPEVCLGPLREDGLPRDLELGAGLIEVSGGAAGAFARPAARIEAATPLPSGSAHRAIVPTTTSSNSSSTPAARWDSAAGEGRHAP
jgi:hypothetical protein